jgi:hypothetical protein
VPADGAIGPGPGPGADAAARADSGPRPNGTDSGAKPPPPPANGTEAHDQWCDTIAEPLCNNVFACCDMAAQANVGGSLAACLPAVASACRADFLSGLVDLYDSGQTGFDGGALAACGAALDANAATCDRNMFLTLYLSCVIPVWPGLNPPGFTCENMMDQGLDLVVCAGGRCQDGVCAPFVADGAPCAPGGGDCNIGNGRICRPGPAGGFQCLPFLDEGDACMVDVMCGSLFCSPATGTCGPVQDVCAMLPG